MHTHVTPTNTQTFSLCRTIWQSPDDSICTNCSVAVTINAPLSHVIPRSWIRHGHEPLCCRFLQWVEEGMCVICVAVEHFEEIRNCTFTYCILTAVVLHMYIHVYLVYIIYCAYITPVVSFCFIGRVSGKIVAFNATRYSAIISQDTPAQGPVLSVGLTVDGTETYTLSTIRGVTQPVSPFLIRFNGERKGEIYVRATIKSNQVFNYKFTVRSTLATNADITTNVDITVVRQPLSEWECSPV